MAISGGDGSIVLTTKVDDKGLKSGANSIKSFGKKLGKSLLAVGAAATAATVAITKMAVSAYADYEQLVGGVETLFKGSADKVKAYAEDAFYTAGISANEYMQQVTSFSASLISSTAGDTDRAADVANMALMDMSDNANKMGTSMESITMAYQGFAKQQYMLLDNLKLGYGGTKTEMERLLQDAQAITGVKYNINNLADVYSAIHAIQEQLGITGTTAKEAEKTISGSANMMKASWKNVLSAIAGGGDLDKAINNLVYSITKYFDNIVPVVERALQGIGTLIEQVAPMLVETVARSLARALPSLVKAVYNMIIGMAKGIYDGILALVSGTAVKTIEKQTNQMGDGISQNTKLQNDFTDAVEETKKAQKGMLAGFDELNVLTESATENQESLASGVSGGSASPSVGVAQPDGSVEEVKSGVNEMLTTIMSYVGWGMVAIGLILLFTGHIGWGVGLIIAGAGTIGATQAAMGSADFGIAEQLTTIIGGIGLLVAAIGLILLLKTKSPIAHNIGLGMIIAGAGIFAINAVQTAANNMGGSIGKMLHGIIAIVTGLVLAIGLIMLFSGQITPVSIGLVVTGAVGLASEVSLYPDAVVESLRGWLGAILALLSTALLVIGIIMCATSHITPVSIGLIVTGAVGLASTAAINWNYIVEQMRGRFGKIMAIVSAGLIVIGLLIILASGGAALGLGLGLIIAGAAGLATVVAFNWDYITDAIKGVWQSIVNFWNSYIAPWFTLKKWADLAKNIVDGILGALSGLGKLFLNIFSAAWEGVLSVFSLGGKVFKGISEGILNVFKTVVNFLIDGINAVVGLPFKGLNKILDMIHDVSIVGMHPFGWLDWRAPVPKIPHLATGAVLPPNKPFMAVVGDQKHGTNIEAPLDTIKQALSEVLSQVQMPAQQDDRPIVLQIDGREIARAVRNGENKMGSQIVFGGFANAY